MGVAGADRPPQFVVTYGVWIAGHGWLAKNRQTLCDPRREVAESACALWGPGAAVMPVDESLVDLQDQFLAQEKERAHELSALRSRSFRGRALSWLRRAGARLWQRG